MCKIVSIFNHKGRVGKTTTVFNLGYKIASMGKRVLIVDADPQCDLTRLTLGFHDYESFLKFYANQENTDIFKSLAPRFGLDTFNHTINKAETLVTKTKNDNLFLLAGNIRLSEIDRQIATAFTASSGFPVLKILVNSIGDFLRSLIDKYSLDIILIDTNSSLSSTNQTILATSDYFIIPFTQDFYCYQAIASLGNFLPKWINEVNILTGKLSNILPKMLGFITQNYDNHSSKYDEHYNKWLDRIKHVVMRDMKNCLKDSDMLHNNSNYKAPVYPNEPYILAEIPDFYYFIHASQVLSDPIYETTNRSEVDEVYTNMAKEVLQRLI